MPFPRGVAKAWCLSPDLAGIFSTLMGTVSVLFAQSTLDPLKLTLLPHDTNGWIHVHGRAFDSNSLVTVSASSNLVNWQTIAVLHAGSFDFFDPASATLGQRFYRFETDFLRATNDWKNQLSLPYDPFYLGISGPQQWTKFAILADDPTRVFYADSHRFTFHYDFATARLEPFLGMMPGEFDAVSQFNSNRAVILGTILVPGYPRTEYGIQFVSQDPLSRETIRDLFALVKSTIVPDPTYPDGPVQAFYIPTFEQLAVAQTNAGFFASHGIPVSAVDRWIGGDVCYSGGWALGTLKFFSATNVVAAYADGRLGPADILVTDGIPAELPYVSGLITLAAATANSHVAILAQSYGVPFAYLIDEVDRARVLEWTNREIAFQSGDFFNNGNCNVFIHPIEGPLEPRFRTNLFALRNGPAFEFAPKQIFGTYTAPVDNLLPSDIKFFGGKAANYGLLRRVIPANAEPAIAISFDLWNEFMEQTLLGGVTLRLEISNRLAGFTYPPNVGVVQAQLGAIRTLIRNGTQFTASQRDAITNALSVFDRRRNIRFRSSTNVEDAESFSGAGLYDSYSGCLADDQDDDNDGPSACDPTEEDERGVFRAIRRVYASFYNDNAFLERLRLGVDETKVGMAALVHHSTPDEFEMANGVATGRWQTQYSVFDGRIVSQPGAVSVANPDGSSLPETVDFDTRSNRAPSVTFRQGSSLLRLGDTVMTWTNDYLALANLLHQVARGYGAMFPNKPDIQLDIEFKKVAPGVLELKQVREIPTTTNRYVAPFVLNAPEVTFGNWHGFYDGIFLAHRLKSRWTLRHRNVRFTPSELEAGFYTDISIEYLNGTNVQTFEGPLTTFPNHAHTPVTNLWSSVGGIEDRWTLPATGFSMSLKTSFDREVEARAPFRTIPETLFYGLELDVHFSQPVFQISVFGEISHATNYSTRLYPFRMETSADLFRETTFDVSGQGTNIHIASSYWLPFQARGDDCRCPLLRIVESRIEGFTTTPLVLRGYWSQTFEDIHAHGYVQFLFEPRLEPGLSPQQLSELSAADIAQIYVNGNGEFNQPVLMIIGFDGSPRRFSDQDFGF